MNSGSFWCFEKENGFCDLAGVDVVPPSKKKLLMNFTLCLREFQSQQQLLQGKIANGHGKLNIVSQNAARFAKKCNWMKVFGAK